MLFYTCKLIGPYHNLFWHVFDIVPCKVTASRHPPECEYNFLMTISIFDKLSKLMENGTLVLLLAYCLFVSK